MQSIAVRSWTVLLSLSVNLTAVFAANLAVEFPPNIVACITGMRGTPPTSVDASRYTAAKGATVALVNRDFIDGILNVRRSGFTMKNLGSVEYGGRRCSHYRYTDFGTEMNPDRPLVAGETPEFRARTDANMVRQSKGREHDAYTANEDGRVYLWDSVENAWFYTALPAMADGATWIGSGRVYESDPTRNFPAGERAEYRWVWVGNFESPVTGRPYREVFAMVMSTATSRYASFFAPDVGVIYTTYVATRDGKPYRSEMFAE